MMKTKFYALLFFLTVAMSGCDNEYDDTGIRTQIAEVTDQVKALQTLTEALQNRDYILSVVPTTVEGVPGYLITFAQAEPVTILCGTSVIAAVDTSHGDYVVFTLADGTTTITLPRSNAVTIGLDGYDVLYCTASSLDIPLLFPATLKSGDYTSIAATVTNDNGTGTDIQTRASAGTNGVWKVDITQPAFGDDGMIIPNSSKVTLTPPKHVKLSDTAILKVTLVDKRGMETTVTRPIKYSVVAAVTSTAGNLSSVATDAEMTALAIKGSVDATDLAYIRNTLTKLEVLDLSMTDMVTLPGWGLGFHPDDGYQPNTTLKEVMLPASLVTIGKSAFLNCRALDYVDTGNAETITEYAFEGCSNLREVILSEKLKTVGNCAFRNCVSLSLIDIPGSVETLGRWVFENCGNLQSVVLHEGVQSLSESTFYGCGIRSVSIPSTVTSIPKWTFQDCKYLGHVNWHDGITSIGEAAFNRCTSLRNIRIPAGVTSIADDTFYGCTVLHSVGFHDNITRIGVNAFDKCYALALEEVNQDNPYNLPASLTTLGECAFQNCTGITRVCLPEGVTVVPKYAFNGCTKLNGVVLSEQTATIGDWAFAGTALTGISLPATVTALGDNVFHNCSELIGIQSYATTAPTITATTFSHDKGTIKEQCRLFVLPAASSAYDSWKNYFKALVADLTVQP